MDDEAHAEHFRDCCALIERKLRRHLVLPDDVQVPGLEFVREQLKPTLSDTRVKIYLPNTNNYPELHRALLRENADLTPPKAENGRLVTWLKVYKRRDTGWAVRIWLAIVMGTFFAAYGVYQHVEAIREQQRAFIG